MFIGREKELDAIVNSIKKPNNHIMVYGNRRIGKTTLVQEAILKSNLNYVSYECEKSSLSENVNSLIEKLKYFKLIPEYITFNGLEDIFIYLNSLNKHLIIFIDEYPYLYFNNEKSYIDSLFQKIIDHCSSNLNIVLSGSYVGMMKDLTTESNPLFGRFNLYLHLQEFDYLDASKFYPHLSNYDKVAFYAVFGGSPFILSQLDYEKSLKDNIKNTFLKLDSSIYMYLSEGITSESAMKENIKNIFKAIKNGKIRHNRLEDRLGLLHNGLLSKQIKVLCDMDLLGKNYPINKKDDNKKATYYIKNNALKFFYTYIYSNGNTITMIGRDMFYEQFIQNNLTTFISLRFENIGQQFLSRKVKTDQLKGVLDIGTYYYDDQVNNQNGEFDIAVKTVNGYIIFDVKYYQNPINKDILFNEIEAIKKIKELEIYQMGFIVINGYIDKSFNVDYYFDGNDLYNEGLF